MRIKLYLLYQFYKVGSGVGYKGIDLISQVFFLGKFKTVENLIEDI
jgi:hypothetical protein